MEPYLGRQASLFYRLKSFSVTGSEIFFSYSVSLLWSYSCMFELLWFYLDSGEKVAIINPISFPLCNCINNDVASSLVQFILD